ncbi:tetratricopeptide repeat protein [Halomonas sp. PAMB 3232]|uniref:tetratricopeptide repeat protein n=1 Tax=Halomonas sp. PAMB 3232 TaxID=3075221 RepID=UPI00289CF12F|nr:tetratricopeptide repeat protein [Halomonas sp. PAMB 3232]WNL37905.1 tetratricopeptide repeat protein [Halomonas sp. PAMB 3232]
MPFRATLTGLPRWPLAVTLLLSGCQATPSSSVGGLPAFIDDPMASAPPITRGLDAEGLRTLLTAEMAGQRGDFSRASQGYLAASRRYPVAALAERATFAARFGNDTALMETSALRWRELAPTAQGPNQFLATLSLSRGDWLDSLEQRLAIVSAGGNGEIAAFAELAVAENAPLGLLIRPLRDFLDESAGIAPLGDEQEGQVDVLLGTALIEAALGNTAQAQARLDEVASQAPDLESLWLARARLALETGDHQGARRAARRGLELAPDDVRFVLMLAQANIRLNNLTQAQEQTDALLERHGGGPDLRVALAQLYLEEGHPDPAYRLLQPMIGEENIPDLAYFLLGAIAQSEGDIDNALIYYRQVREGSEFLPARAAAAQMLIEEDRLLDARAFLRIERMRYDAYFSDLVLLEVQLLDGQNLASEADALLDRELARTPADTGLRYLRAMRAFERGDLAAMERDLRYIIRSEPDNANALNALGYTLADTDSGERLEEARALIERAYELEPDNPAVLDSMGWVLFKQGEPDEALSWLETAFAQMPDQEVAAHLAEVLDALGRVDKARAIVRRFQTGRGDTPALDELLRRRPALGTP